MKYRKLFTAGILSTAVIVATLFTSVLFGQNTGVDVVVGDVIGRSGQTVSVPVVLNTRGTLVRSVEVNFSYDGTVLLTGTGVVGFALPPLWNGTCNEEAPGDLRCVASAIAGSNADISGTLFDISFVIDSNYTTGTLPIVVVTAEVFNDANTLLLSSVIDGSVVVAVTSIETAKVVIVGLPANVERLEVLPTVIKNSVGFRQQLGAWAHFTDGSTADVTSNVTWTSLTPLVTEVSNTGVVTIVGVGAGTILIEFTSS